MNVKEFLKKYINLKEIYILSFNEKSQIISEEYNNKKSIPKEIMLKEVMDYDYDMNGRWIEVWV